MKAFTIAGDNSIAVFASKSEARNVDFASSVFTSSEGFEALAKTWPSSRLVEIWNALPGVHPVRKFKDRDTAVRRIWDQIQQLSLTASSELKGTGRSRRRETTKKAAILALLQSPDGATAREIMAVVDWQAHSVRGFLSALSKSGYAIESFKRAQGERAYRLSELSQEEPGPEVNGAVD